MFNFGERTTGEKIVMITAGALAVGNTVMNVVNFKSGKRHKKDIGKLQSELSSVYKRLNNIEETVVEQSVDNEKIQEDGEGENVEK